MKEMSGADEFTFLRRKTSLSTSRGAPLPRPADGDAGSTVLPRASWLVGASPSKATPSDTNALLRPLDRRHEAVAHQTMRSGVPFRARPLQAQHLGSAGHFGVAVIFGRSIPMASGCNCLQDPGWEIRKEFIVEQAA